MGNPLHYSLELPQRCLQLIEELWPFAERTRHGGHPNLGPLTTTFLISMSMPIINLPVERIERYKNEQDEGYADDRHLMPLGRSRNHGTRRPSIQRVAFFIPEAWSFAFRDLKSRFNLARPLPDDLADELATEQALMRAAG